MIKNYEEFLKSLKVLRTHEVSECKFVTELDNPFQEASYLISSSGSENKKYYIHPISSIKDSCDSFFHEFQFNEKDRWWASLPLNHVGGFSILVRSYFGNLRPPLIKPLNFKSLLKEIESEGVSVMSLVPTQIYDLVRLQLKSPQRIKKVFVGGSSLSKDLFLKAKALGWPLVKCYGSTETFAQMSYSIDGDSYCVFKNWEFKIDEEKKLYLKGPSVFKAFFNQEGECFLNTEEWLNTGDLADEVTGESFRVLGKSSGLFKIKGSYFNFNLFKEKFTALLLKNNINPIHIFPLLLEEERNGAGVYLCGSLVYKDKIEDLFESLKEVRGVFYFDSITELQSGLHKPMLSRCRDVLKVPVLSV